MTKSKRKERLLKKEIFMPSQNIESSPKVNPNATLTPEASLEEPTGDSKLGEDSTSFLPGEEEFLEESSKKVPPGLSSAALVASRILNWLAVPFLLAIIVIGIVFIQDNGAGRLISLKDMYWAFKKSGIVLGSFYVILVINYIYKKKSKKKNKTH